MKYYKNDKNELFVDPIVSNHTGLTEITQEEFDTILNPPKSAEELAKIAVKEIESSIQAMLDNQAKELGYDSIVSACSYAGYPNDFQTEAIALGVWRSAVWSKAYELQATMVEVPTVEEILVQLPKYGEEI